MNLALFLTAIIISTSYSGNQLDTTTENSGFFIKSDKDVLISIPYTHQIDDLNEESKSLIRNTACGPASVTMALKHLEDSIKLNEVINALPNSVYVKGDRFYNLYDAEKFFNKKTNKFKNSYSNIFSVLNEGHPVILNIQNYDNITGHAIVVVGMKDYENGKAKSLIAHDPYRGPYREFVYLDENTLLQPEGNTNYIGILDPFYITDKENNENLHLSFKISPY